MNARPTRGKILSWAACWLGAGCATYESTPPEGPSPTQAGSVQGGGGTTNGPGTLPTPGGGTVGLGSAGGTGVAGSKADAGANAGSSHAGESAAGESAAGGATGSAGNASAGSPALGPLGPWLFDGDADGWEVRDHSPGLSPAFASDAGLIRFADVAFTETKEFLDFAYVFPSPADLSGLTLRARLRRASGGFVGVQLYVYGGAWASGGFVTLSSLGFSDVSLVIDDIANADFTKTEVSRIGLKVSTGSNDSNTFGPTSLEIDEVSLPLAAAAGATHE